MLYHKDTGIPKRIKGIIPTGKKCIRYGKHSQNAFYDKYGHINPPSLVNFGLCEVVEVTVFGDKLDKLVLRQQYDDEGKFDIVFVVVPTEDKTVWFAKTVWLNEVSDNHKTLDLSRIPA